MSEGRAPAIYRIERRLLELCNQIERELDTEGEQSRTLRLARMEMGCGPYLTEVYAARCECASARVPIEFYTPILNEAERMFVELAAFVSSPSPPSMDVERLASDADAVPVLPLGYGRICERNEKAWNRFLDLQFRVGQVVNNLLSIKAEVSIRLASATDPDCNTPKGGRGGQTVRRKSGRPKGTEKDSTTKVVAALSKWHGYENGSVTNPKPATNRGLANRFGLSPNSLSRFLKKQFANEGEPTKKYKTICRNGKIGTVLALWNRELPNRMPGLTAAESGRPDHED